MNVVDRMVATDRAVASYRRFVESPYNDTAPEMIADLLHWFRVYVDRHLTMDGVQELLLRAASQYEEDLVEFGLGHDPMRSNRHEVESPFVHDEIRFMDEDDGAVYDPQAEVPLPARPRRPIRFGQVVDAPAHRTAPPAMTELEQAQQFAVQEMAAARWRERLARVEQENLVTGRWDAVPGGMRDE